MTFFKAAKETTVAGLVLSALTLTSGCHTERSGNSESGSAPAYAPSETGTTVAQQPPGAGVGAQASAGAAADVPASTEKGSGASDLTPATPRQAGVAGTPITDVSMLSTTSDPSALAGRPINLSGLQVQQVFSDRMLSVRGSDGKPICVRLHEPVQNITQGDTIGLAGMIGRMPSGPTRLGFSQQDIQALQGQPIYIDAKQIQVTSR